MLKLFLPFLLLPLSNTVEFSPYKDDILFRIDWHPSTTKLSEIEVGPGQKLDASMCLFRTTSEFNIRITSVNVFLQKKSNL